MSYHVVHVVDLCVCVCVFFVVRVLILFMQHHTQWSRFFFEHEVMEYVHGILFLFNTALYWFYCYTGEFLHFWDIL